jgi:hypothetical protein
MKSHGNKAKRKEFVVVVGGFLLLYEPTFFRANN